jgi:hypothetical protein
MKLSTPPVFSAGELGKLAQHFAQELTRIGWPRFHCTLFHHQISSTNANICHIPHPVAPLLHRLATNGIPAPSATPPWSFRQKDAAVRRDPHLSASRLYSRFLLEDMYDMVRIGFWLVLPYSAIRHQRHLKISPSGVIPQRERRPRTIVDYTFSGINQHSPDIAPIDAMQFGQALQCCLQCLAYCNPSYGPPRMAKIDLADGYYRPPPQPGSCLRTCRHPP